MTEHHTLRVILARMVDTMTKCKALGFIDGGALQTNPLSNRDGAFSLYKFIGNLPENWASEIMHNVVPRIGAARNARKSQRLVHSFGGGPGTAYSLEPAHAKMDL